MVKHSELGENFRSPKAQKKASFIEMIDKPTINTRFKDFADHRNKTNRVIAFLPLTSPQQSYIPGSQMRSFKNVGKKIPLYLEIHIEEFGQYP